MEDNNILNKILEDTYTFAEFRKRVKVLKAILVMKLFGDPGQAKNLAEQFGAQEVTWFDNLDQTFLAQFNKDNIYSEFERIEQTITGVNVLNVYLPFEVNSQIITNLGQYMRRLFGSPREATPEAGEAGKVILFDIKFDPNLIAGCALSWQGIYRDYSLRKRIEDNKAQILENFRKYLK